ncbi:MAG: indole-3-glycerol-phosphate synthase [Thermoanaerobaculia bacterium]
MPPADILQRIVATRRQRLGAPAPLALPAVRTTTPAAAGTNRFVQALRTCSGRAVIAEVKMGSPRLGSLAGRVDPERQAAVYRDHGAAALSVVVEPDYFLGSYELLARARGACGLPTIAKDFLVTERQLDDAVVAGADAFLLIAALFEPEELRYWAGEVRARGMAPLVETHDADDLSRLGGADWEMVGINNRDLKTFDVSLAASIALRPAVPAGALAVAESGIAGGSDVRRLRDAGFDAFLIGESLLLADDPARHLAELLS